ncbi:MAG: hypothetical protein M3140_11200 [Actinomycetota bacterium]|nr:hypothetical protein [Actinomycetota bacterium]
MSVFRRRRDPPAKTPVQHAAEETTRLARELQAAVVRLNRMRPEGEANEQRHKPA